MSLAENAQLSILRALIQDVVEETLAKSRAPLVVPGNVEDISDDLDVAFVRMDSEAYESEIPGVITVQRQGNMQIDEQARVHFDRSAGATAYATSLGKLIVLPYGAEMGKRLIIDGSTGTIEFYSEMDELVGFLSADQWFVGREGSLIARLDPAGGLRLRDEADALRAQLSATEGLILRHGDAEGGVTGLIASDEGLTVLDPTTGDHITVSSGSSTTAPAPHYAGSAALSPGSSHSTPTIGTFGTADDLDLRFVCASAASDLGAQSYTPPGSYTEQSDVNGSGAGITLATTVATRDPAIEPPGTQNFTNTSAGWTRRNGHTVIVRGGGSTSPSFRSLSVTPVLGVSSTDVFLTAQKPAGVVAGDILVAFVAMAGPAVPVGWSVPEGWKQLGIQPAVGSGHLLASGIWYKQAGSSEPTEYGIEITMASPAFTKFHATIVAIQNPFLFPGGLDIRRNNRSMPRGLEAINSQTDSDPSAGGTFHTADATTDLVLNDVALKAGRTYQIQVHCGEVNFLQIGGAGGFSWTLRLRKDGVNFRRMGTWGFTTDGAFTEPLDSSIYYVPTADEVVDFDLRWDELTGTGGVRMEGASDNARTFSVVDMGATF
jgi:hypothetical protein